MFLDKETFATVLDSTPLVSIDLIVRNPKDKILLGRRLNRPAQGYWFVPGGRILKEETLAAAFRRLTKTELGTVYDIANARLLGPFDHIYDDSVLGGQITTHYVAIAYEIVVEKLADLPEVQHSAYQWLSKSQLLGWTDVHENTKAYFR